MLKVRFWTLESRFRQIIEDDLRNVTHLGTGHSCIKAVAQILIRKVI